MSVFKYVNNTGTDAIGSVNTVKAWDFLQSATRLPDLEPFVNKTLDLYLNGVEQNSFVEVSKDSSGNSTGLTGTKVGIKYPFAKPIRTIAVIGDSISNLNSMFGLNFSGITIPGVCVSDVPRGNIYCPTGSATLTYTAANKTLTFTAPGDTPGVPIPIKDGIFEIPSGNPSYTLNITVTSRSLGTVDKTDTLTSGTRYWRRNTGGWMYVADALTYNRFIWLPHFGIGGNRSTDIANRYDQILNSGADLIIDQCGTNDFSAMTPAQSVAARAANWDKALAMGIPVIVMLISPRFGLSISGAATNDSPLYTAALQGKIQTANNGYISEAKKRIGVYVADNWSKAVKFADANGRLKDGYAGADGLHPSGGLTYEYGAPPARILNNLVPDDRIGTNPGLSSYYDSTNNPTGNLLRPGEGTFIGTGGTPGTGVTAGTGLATGWNAQVTLGTMTVVANKVAATDGGADWQEFVCSAGSANGVQVYLTCGTLTIANIQAGDKLSASFEYQRTGTGLIGVNADILFTGGNLPVWEAQQMTNVYQGIREDGIISFENLTITPGLTAAQPRLYLQSAISGAFTIRIRNFNISKIV